MTLPGEAVLKDGNAGQWPLSTLGAITRPAASGHNSQSIRLSLLKN
jgi:hypothetical protein